MSLTLSIFCTSSEAIDKKEIEDFISEGTYFDDDPVLEGNNNNENWSSLELHYQKGKRPIVFSKDVNNDFLKEEIEEIIEKLKGSKSKGKLDMVLKHLKSSKQVIAMELNSDSMDDDAWEMIDNLQSHIATTYGGLIYVADEGFYNADLKRIFKY